LSTSKPDLRRWSRVQLAGDECRPSEWPNDQDSLLATDSLHENAIHETPLVELEIDRIGFSQRAPVTIASWGLRNCARRRDQQREREQ
jgi:hypothetical protein